MTVKLDNIARVAGDNLGASVDAQSIDAPALYRLPIPPSVNQAFANKRRGRVLTAKAKDWKTYAGHVLRRQLIDQGKRSGPVIIVANVERPNKTSDIDNRVKLLIDLLVENDAIDDDKNVVAIAFSWTPKVEQSVTLGIIPSRPFNMQFHTLEETGALGVWTLPALQSEPEKEAA